MHERRVEQTAGPGGRPRCAVGCTLFVEGTRECTPSTAALENGRVHT